MERIRDILNNRQPYFADASQTVCAVARKMAEVGVGAILILRNGQLAGIFSERDLMKRVIVGGLDPDKTPVETVMTTDLATIEESATVEAAMEMMQRHSCRHLPVLRQSQVVGMVSMRDLMNVELDKKTDEIKQMRAYIHGQ